MSKIFLYRSPDIATSSHTAGIQTDNSKLVTTDTVYVSPDGGTTDEPFPKQGVEYDFCVDVSNSGNLSSDSFFVRFNLSGDQDPPLDLDFKQDDGLEAGSSIKAVAHFGSFPNKFAVYHLVACIYDNSSPGTAINCSSSFDITINSETENSSGSASVTDSANETESTNN